MALVLHKKKKFSAGCYRDKIHGAHARKLCWIYSTTTEETQQSID